MKRVFKNIGQFVHLIKDEKSLVLNKRGAWKEASPFYRLIEKIFGLNFRWKEKLVSNFLNLLEEVEKISVKFSQHSKLPSQVIDFSSYLQAGKALVELLDLSQHKKAVSLNRELKRHLVALQFRLGRVNGGQDITTSRRELRLNLMQLACQWLENNPVISRKSLSQRDKAIIEEIAKYPSFAELVVKDTNLANLLFKWTIRDKNKVDIFIQFPFLQKKLDECRLSGRIGRLGGNKLKIKYRNISKYEKEKIVTLPFEGVDQNILNLDKVITFRGNYQLSISETLSVFKNKVKDVGNIEYLADGFVNWNVHRWGFWNADKKSYETVDLDNPKWWEQLPVVEKISIDEAKKRFGKHINGSNWNLAATSTRGQKSLAIEDCHSFIQIAAPTGNGRYHILPFGKYALDQPLMFSAIEGLSILCNFATATVAYPDENIFYSFREHTTYSFPLSSVEGMVLMSSIKQDMFASKEGNLIYQIEADNCAKYVNSKLEWLVGKERLPDIFKMSFLDTESGGAIAVIFWFVKCFPKKWQSWVITRMHLPFGAHKGRWVILNGKPQYLCLKNTAFWNDIVVYHPALLHIKQEQGFIGRVFGTDFSTAYDFCKLGVSQFDRLNYNLISRLREYITQLGQFSLRDFILSRTHVGPSPPGVRAVLPSPKFKVLLSLGSVFVHLKKILFALVFLKRSPPGILTIEQRNIRMLLC